VSSRSPLGGTTFAAGPRYLNTAAIGLPPRVVLDAVGDRLAEWEAGGSVAPSFDPDVDRARRAYARIVGTTSDAVALVNQVSLASGLVAGSLPDGARVLCAEEDFASVLAPFLADDRLRVATVPLAGLLDAITPAVDLVAVSAVQSADGRVLDLDALAGAATAAGARTYVDVTQAAGWLPLGADRFDVTAVGAYKWLCSPRGSGFLTVGPHNDWLRPSWAGWYSAPDPWGDLYGPPLRLAADARRFDVSPPWFAIVGAARALELIDDLGVETIGAHSVALANRFRAGLDLVPSDSAIVSVASDRGPDLAEAGYVASERAGKVRVSFYLYNTEADADGAAAVLAGRPVPATSS
jgi:selenocysteine lyase/cysteine desulfurase